MVINGSKMYISFYSVFRAFLLLRLAFIGFFGLFYIGLLCTIGFRGGTTYGRGVWISPIPVESILSTSEFQLKNISIYPNPSSGLFNITSGDKKIDDVVVYDITGKKLISILSNAKGNFQNILDLSSLSSGTYFVEIQVENQKIIKRLVKK